MIEPAELKDLEEVWASTTGGTVFVWKSDPLRAGNYIQKIIGGPGNVKMKLTVAEREYNQDLVAYGNEELCPFRNGLLVRVLPKMDIKERGKFEMTDQELELLIKGGTEEEFQETIAGITSEVVLRRMASLAINDRTVSNGRTSDLIDLIRERYPQGRGSRFVDELHEHESKMRSLSMH